MVRSSPGSLPRVKPPGWAKMALSLAESAAESAQCMSESMALIEPRSPRMVPDPDPAGSLAPFSSRSRSWLPEGWPPEGWPPAWGPGACDRSATSIATDGPKAKSWSTSRYRYACQTWVMFRS